MNSVIVKTQDQFDQAVESKAKEIEIQGNGEFVNRTYNGRIVIKGNSAPSIYNQDSSSPRIFNRDSSAPQIYNRDSSSPQIFEHRTGYLDKKEEVKIQNNQGSNFKIVRDIFIETQNGDKVNLKEVVSLIKSHYPELL